MLGRSPRVLSANHIFKAQCPRVSAALYYMPHRASSSQTSRTSQSPDTWEESFLTGMIEHTRSASLSAPASIFIREPEPVDLDERNSPDAEYVNDWDTDPEYAESPADWQPIRSSSEKRTFENYQSVVFSNPSAAVAALRERVMAAEQLQKSQPSQSKKVTPTGDVKHARPKAGAPAYNTALLWLPDVVEIQPNHKFTSSWRSVETHTKPDFPSLADILKVKYPKSPSAQEKFWQDIQANALAVPMSNDKAYLTTPPNLYWTLPHYLRGSLPDEFRVYLEACYMSVHGLGSHQPWSALTKARKKRYRSIALDFYPEFIASYHDVLDHVAWDQDAKLGPHPDLAKTLFEQVYKGRQVLRIPGGFRQFHQAIMLKFGDAVKSFRPQRRTLFMLRSWHALSKEDKMAFCLDAKLEFETWHQRSTSWINSLDWSIQEFSGSGDR